ncbi:MAG: ABC transporter permease [Acidobacteria bacterium]|nr:ABC transporter permease [Acidobacteriota bacterium]
MASVWSDIRYAVRVCRAHPGVTLVAVLSLALGIGANSTMFSLVDGMLLRPLPARDPGSLVWISARTAEGRGGAIGWLDYLDLKESATAFADIAVQNRRGAILPHDGEAELALMTLVSDNYFPLLGVEAARGRLFRDDLDRTMQNQPAVVISDSLWRRRFGADPGLIGPHHADERKQLHRGRDPAAGVPWSGARPAQRHLGAGQHLEGDGPPGRARGARSGTVRCDRAAAPGRSHSASPGATRDRGRALAARVPAALPRPAAVRDYGGRANPSVAASSACSCWRLSGWSS